MTRHILVSREEEILFDGENLLIVSVLITFQALAFTYSVFEIYVHRLAYFTYPWKRVDMLAHLFTWIYLIGYVADSHIPPIILALSIWFMWCRLISFVRVVDEVRYYIRMIIDIIKGMSSFLMILVLFVLAHSFGLMALREGETYEDYFMIAYKLMFGDFETFYETHSERFYYI